MITIKTLKRGRNRIKTTKVKEYQYIYQDKRWVKIKQARRLNNPICEICEKNGITKETSDIHHIIPFILGLDAFEVSILAFSYENTMSVCDKCHANIHNNFVLDTKLQYKLLKR